MIQLLQRLQQEGPVRIVLSEADYQMLRSETKRIWIYTDTHRRWSRDDQLIVLGFLAGHSFYREINLDERHFWNGFNSELGLPRKPQAAIDMISFGRLSTIPRLPLTGSMTGGATLWPPLKESGGSTGSKAMT
jgi:hypothetical protein